MYSVSLARLVLALLVHRGTALGQCGETCQQDEVLPDVVLLQVELNRVRLEPNETAPRVARPNSRGPRQTAASLNEQHAAGAAGTAGTAAAGFWPGFPFTPAPTDDGRWCGFTREDGGLVPIYKDIANHRLLLDLTSVLKDGGVLRFMVTAMSIAGTFDDGRGYSNIYANPEEEATQNTMYEFRLSPDAKAVDAYKSIVSRRTSDSQTEKALKKGVGSGWLGDISTQECKRDGVTTARGHGTLGGSWSAANEWPTAAPEEWWGDREADSWTDAYRIVIDASDLLWGGFFVTPSVRHGLKYRLLRAKTYPKNLDISAEYLMGGTAGPRAIGYSMVFLPETPMAPRVSDDRVLYFTTEYRDLGQHSPQSQEQASDAADREVSMIWRYNLAAQPGRQIRIYVDPTVPFRWWKYFREGIEAWNDAFALAGHPKAMRAVLPTDPDWPSDYDISDARYSTISWSPSDQAVSMGVAKVDPRSGEIIKSDIIMSEDWVNAWFLDIDLLAPNVTLHFDKWKGYRFELRSPGAAAGRGKKPAGGLKLLELWSGGAGSVQGALGAASILAMGTDQPNGKLWTQEDVIGQGLRQIVMHEVGHTLGLRHNFKGSMGVSYECTQNISCSAVHGLSNSVMDYLPLNFPAAGVDHVHAFSPVIGAYDKVAIRYGYMDATDQWWPGSALQIVPQLQRVLVEAEAYPPCYDSDNGGEDPGCVAYDFSSDPLRYNRERLYRIAEVQKTLLETGMRPGASYKRYGESARNLLYLAANTALDGFRWVGGTSNSYVHRGADGKQARRAAREPVPAATQREALALLLRTLRPGLVGLLPPAKDLRYLIQGSFDDEVLAWNPADDAAHVASTLVASALEVSKIAQLNAQETFAAAASPGLPRFGVSDLLSGLTTSVMTGNISDPSEWDLQASLVKGLTALYRDATLPESVLSQVLVQIDRLDDTVADAFHDVDDIRGASEPALLRAHLLRLHHQYSDAICAKDANCVINELDSSTQGSASAGPKPVAFALGLAALVLIHFV